MTAANHMQGSQEDSKLEITASLTRKTRHLVCSTGDEEEEKRDFPSPSRSSIFIVIAPDCTIFPIKYAIVLAPRDGYQRHTQKPSDWTTLLLMPHVI